MIAVFYDDAVVANGYGGTIGFPHIRHIVAGAARYLGKVKLMNIFKSVKEEVLVPIHPAGWPFIFLFWLVTFVASYFWFLFLLPGSFLSLVVYFPQSKTHNAYW